MGSCVMQFKKALEYAASYLGELSRLIPLSVSDLFYKCSCLFSTYSPYLPIYSPCLGELSEKILGIELEIMNMLGHES